VRGAHCSLHHTIGAYGEVSSHHTLGACVSPFQDFARNAFGFHRTEGATNTKAPMLLIGAQVFVAPELKPSQTFEIILPNLIHKSKKRNLK